MNSPTYEREAGGRKVLIREGKGSNRVEEWNKTENKQTARNTHNIHPSGNGRAMATYNPSMPRKPRHILAS